MLLVIQIPSESQKHFRYLLKCTIKMNNAFEFCRKTSFKRSNEQQRSQQKLTEMIVLVFRFIDTKPGKLHFMKNNAKDSICGLNNSFQISTNIFVGITIFGNAESIIHFMGIVSEICFTINKLIVIENENFGMRVYSGLHAAFIGHGCDCEPYLDRCS